MEEGKNEIGTGEWRHPLARGKRPTSTAGRRGAAAKSHWNRKTCKKIKDAYQESLRHGVGARVPAASGSCLAGSALSFVTPLAPPVRPTLSASC
eukprot:358124-Pleurochrysis_carterae.AAC.1